jgi:CubicO group peptidase (beta-lactamase class C family)
MKKLLLIALITLLICKHSLAQSLSTATSLPDSLVSRIDSIFRYYTKKTPGCAIAIIKNGQPIFQKGYGMANLEYDIPIMPTTIFHIASESKQYVAFCILLLQKEGKLSIDDDIRKHLEWVPDFGQKITIRQLIHHTSGLRDQWQLLANAGWQLDDVITQEHVIKLVSKQKELNFKPGDEHMYCNTGYTLLAEIVKKVSGLTLRQYTEQNIFEPLGMKDTHFHDNYQELVPNRAYSYAPGGKRGYQNAVLSYSIVGATSLFTTVVDETKWLNNFSTGQVGGKDLIEKMYEVGVLNNGRKLNYAFALVIDNFKGWKQIGHGGADAGYRTFACRFPEKDLGIAVFSNSAIANPGGLARQVAGLFITDTKGNGVPDGKSNENDLKPGPGKQSGSNLPDSNLLKKFAGRYYSVRGDLETMFWNNGKLYRGNRGVNNPPEIKVVLRDKSFVVPTGRLPVVTIDLKNLQADSVMELIIENANGNVAFKRLPSTPLKLSGNYSGRYYSEETEAFYTIVQSNGKLKLTHRKFSDADLTQIAPDQFRSPYWWMSHIRFLRDNKNNITGFEVNAGRILGLKYQRVL